MQVKEVPISFEYDDATLIGILHLPEHVAKIGLLTVVAGGPQYRAGAGRQLVALGRYISTSGVAVMRFDHSGIGDSVGEFRGFEHIEGDIAAAIEKFKELVPGIESIVLWGGCDGASAIMINAWRYPDVTGMILGNPFVSSPETKVAVTRQHYRNRLQQREFWLKLLRFEYNPLDYFKEMMRAKRSKNAAVSGKETDNVELESLPFQRRMLIGLQRYRGDVLFLMSGRSLVSKEFDELIRQDPEWSDALNAVPHQRIDVPEADQTFSTEAARQTIFAEAKSWLLNKK